MACQSDSFEMRLVSVWMSLEDITAAFLNSGDCDNVWQRKTQERMVGGVIRLTPKQAVEPQ
jgi:hypothetical protein